MRLVSALLFLPAMLSACAGDSASDKPAAKVRGIVVDKAGDPRLQQYAKGVDYRVKASDALRRKAEDIEMTRVVRARLGKSTELTRTEKRVLAASTREHAKKLGKEWAERRTRAALGGGRPAGSQSERR